MAKPTMKWYYYVGGTIILMALIGCYYNQPKQFLTNALKLPCVGCGVDNPEGSGVSWGGTCNEGMAQDVLTLCCIPPEVPTCGLDSYGMCGGTCPVPSSWTGYTGVCVGEETYLSEKSRSASLSESAEFVMVAYSGCHCEYSATR